MDVHLVWVQHWLPLWFLVVALFLPRISLLLMYVQHSLGHFEIVVGIVPLLFWLLLPRALVLYLIYLDQGISLWFLLHLLVALAVFGGSGRYHSRGRRFTGRWRE